MKMCETFSLVEMHLLVTDEFYVIWTGGVPLQQPLTYLILDEANKAQMKMI
jgi:hypothetical protein